MYQEDYLENYIKKSELRIFSKNIKVRLSKELATKYDDGIYEKYLTNLQKCYDQINTLNIKYPGNANPILYLYIVPDTNYGPLLKIPPHFDRGKGGGKPVNCYDIDGYNYAYGITQNFLEEYSDENKTISRTENEIHELAHIIHSQFFFFKNQFVCEGFAEALPLYALDYEDKFDEHRIILKELDISKIQSAKELIESEEKNTYGIEAVLPNKSCSFRYSYISSYLFIRGCIEMLKEKNKLTKTEAIQQFLEIVKNSKNRNEWFIFDLANAIEIPKELLLTSKEIQLKIIKSL